MRKFSKLKTVCISAGILISVFATGVQAGTINLANYTIPIDNAKTVNVSKTTNTGKTSCTAYNVSGGKDSIRVWTYSQDLKSLYARILTTVEDGGTTTQSYYSGKPTSKGTKLDIMFRDAYGGLKLSYKTSGNINYY